LSKAYAVAKELLRKGSNNLLSAKVIKEYFSNLYGKINKRDKYGVVELLTPSNQQELGMQFREAADAFNIIDDSHTNVILVPYGEGQRLIGEWNTQTNETAALRKTLRKLQRYTVSLTKAQFTDLSGRGSLDEIFPGVFALICEIEYSDEIGLLVKESPSDSKSYIA
jgi:CRISPR-associated endonuclease/helicase Cas3